MHHPAVVQKGADFAWLRAQARDAATRARLTQVAQWTAQARHGRFWASSAIFPLHLDPYTLWLRAADAWQSVALYTELFKEADHTLLPAFATVAHGPIVDLGANIGLYTLRMRQLNPDVRVIAVEPNPPTVLLLEKNITTNQLTDITVVPAAIGGHTGQLALKTVTQASGFAGKYLGTLKTAQRPWVTEQLITTVSVPCLTLPQLFGEYGLTQVELLKLDIEEMELEVLAAGVAVLGGVQRIVIEWHTEATKRQLVTFLSAHGFQLVFEEPRAFGDLYFERRAEKGSGPA